MATLWGRRMKQTYKEGSAPTIRNRAVVEHPLSAADCAAQHVDVVRVNMTAAGAHCRIVCLELSTQLLGDLAIASLLHLGGVRGSRRGHERTSTPPDARRAV